MKSKKIITGLIIVIILLIVAIMLLLISLKNAKEEINNENSVDDQEITITKTNVVPKTEPKAENKITNMDINDETITKLYSYIPAKNTNLILESAYQSKKVTVNDLPNTYLLSWAFINTKIEDSDKEFYEGDWYRFEANLLQEKVKEMYGKNLPNETFIVGAGASCSYDEEMNKYSYSYGGGSGQGSLNVNKTVKAYSDKDNIYIEDRYIYMTNEADQAGINYAIYTSSDKTGKIKEFTSEELNPYDSYTSLEEYVLANYSSEMAGYKHTFKKAEDGTYYWYSTEPLKLL